MSEPAQESSPAVPWHVLVRGALLVLLVVIGFAILRWSPLAEYVTKEAVLSTLDRLRDAWWAPGALIAGYALLCPVGFPPSPLMVAGGMVFGPVWGSLYNVVGIFFGAASTFLLGRLLGRDVVIHLGGRRIKKVERAIARQSGFWSLAGIRFLPLPFVMVNYAAALAGIRPGLFLGSSLMGLTLSVPIFTYFAAAITRAATGDRSGVYLRLAIALTLLISITLIPRILAARKRRERYREIRARRAARRPLP
jgi:uncharacterized membrane protein YdjX (TVP38/TMEM64 family)